MRSKILTSGLLATLIVTTCVPPLRADSSHYPSTEAIQFAKKTHDLLLAELFAALVQEFAETTPDNVEQGKAAISLMFDDSHSNFRLVGEFEPLRSNDLPKDAFEENALDLALQGQGHSAVARVAGKWFYRSSVPLSNFDPSCAMCHTNFGPVDPQLYVGGLMLKVPIDTGHGHDDD